MPFPETAAVTGGAGAIGAVIGAELAAGGTQVTLVDGKAARRPGRGVARVPAARYEQADVLTPSRTAGVRHETGA